MSPYKIKKGASTPKIQLSYSIFTFCSSISDLNDNTWYHFSFSINQNYKTLKCYLNGISYGIG
jgi:hypothetical protein